MIVGEISLNGEIHGVAGVLPRVIRARELGLRFCVIPEENIREGNLVKDMPVFGVKSLNAMIRCLRDPNTYTAAYQEKEKTENKPEIPKVDFADICGQEGARLAAEILSLIHIWEKNVWNIIWRRSGKKVMRHPRRNRIH